jgi:hypothetical protein
MKKVAFSLLLLVSFAACNNKTDAPDVSGIKVNLVTKRFDEQFFSIDTLDLKTGIDRIQKDYFELLTIFVQNIVGVASPEAIKTFYKLYRPVFDSSQLIYKDFTPIEKELRQAFQYVKYYLPSYQLPEAIIPIIGPMNSREDLARMNNGDYTPNFIGQGFIGISLQFYLGANFSLYNTEYFINTVAPLYRSRRFSKEYIAADVMKLITDDIYPDKSNTKPLVEQMIEKGKQWWLLDKFMPDTPDSIKTGYTQHQLDWCKANEGLIWSTILRNENLYSLNPATIQTYIGEAPFTNVFSQEDSPGNIGAWIGWQMVKKFEAAKPDLKIDAIMKAPAKQVLEEGKYKPK